MSVQLIKDPEDEGKTCLSVSLFSLSSVYLLNLTEYPLILANLFYVLFGQVADIPRDFAA